MYFTSLWPNVAGPSYQIVSCTSVLVDRVCIPQENERVVFPDVDMSRNPPLAWWLVTLSHIGESAVYVSMAGMHQDYNSTLSDILVFLNEKLPTFASPVSGQPPERKCNKISWQLQTSINTDSEIAQTVNVFEASSKPTVPMQTHHPPY